MQVLRIGIDVGSTTVKIVVIDDTNRILFKKYTRHKSKVREVMLKILYDIMPKFEGASVSVALSGSAAMSIAENAKLPFVQEVFATRNAVSKLIGGIDAVVELGGEDAKILFLTGGSEERMNGTCAGGTGAFIDQMASLMNVSVDELDELSLQSVSKYNIASRCGVFAKSDIQPLLNQGASKADIAISIFQAIVDQTIGGLAQGRRIQGRVAFLGGPLTFFKGLQKCFVETLNLNDETAVFPNDSEFYVALGAAYRCNTEDNMTFRQLYARLQNVSEKKSVLTTSKPLFADKNEYDEFLQRHNKNAVRYTDISTYEGNAYLGIDCGSTTTKLVLIGEHNEILYDFYAPNNGEPLSVTIDKIREIYSLIGDRAEIIGSAVTGYGEEHIKNTLDVDFGIVETVAHLYSAKYFNPDVDFIIDIGGQDIKCFKLLDGVIDSIMLNEACSSGCGSFISTFSEALGYDVRDFANLGLYAKHPVNLGSRCTVFMNSSVKQAQKDGASVGDISAGISMSVVKNAIYKVIRANSAKELGQNIVVQGGTFLNDAVLRAFEREIGADVVRPNIAGLMGAYGAALYAKNAAGSKSSLIGRDIIGDITYTSKTTLCKGCENKCKLIVTTLNTGKVCITGNRCDKMIKSGDSEDIPDSYQFKLNKLQGYRSDYATRGKIGLPLGLNMYENLPFWHTLFSTLKFNVVVSGTSNRAIYTLGQHTIPSDTVCYPAKLMHGHIISLIKKGIDRIFYPCLPYNFNEEIGDNHYNCPVVSYYPELIVNNMSELKGVKFYNPYFAPHEYKSFKKSMCKFLQENFDIPKQESIIAINRAYEEYEKYRNSLYEFGDQVVKNNKRVIIMAGRPYHIDPEVNHGINTLLTSLGFAVMSEDCIRPERRNVHVLNQWTYHSRMYNAAYFACERANVNVVQIVSFGCGLDAITTDEVRDILHANGKLYTQIKIDEINNLGAARIRLRTLAHVIDENIRRSI